MSLPLVSFLLVNWNTGDLLIECLESVSQTVCDIEYETWVVDNASSDGSVELVRQMFPDALVIENSKNLGFAKANNQALRKMRGKYAVLLNTDTVLREDAIRRIVDFMEESPDVAVCGGQLLNADGSRQNSIANFPTLATELANKSILRRLSPGRYPGKETVFKGPVEVESIVGACMAVRAKAIDDVGLLDEDYFFFLEETDWCLRFRQKGWKVFHHPEAEIYHIQGQSAKKEYLRARVQYWLSRYIFFQKNRGMTVRVLLGVGLMVKLLLDLALTFFYNAATLFLIYKARLRLLLYLRLLLWHLRGCPTSWGLIGGGS